MPSIEDFPFRMQKRISQLNRGLTVLVRNVVMAADRTCVETTPVDTGEARSNWIVSVGAPDESVRPAYIPYPKYSGPALEETGNAAAAIAQGGIALNGFDITAKDTVYIQNNLPYIGKLNDGTQSKQSANMLEQGAQAGIEALRSSPVILV